MCLKISEMAPRSEENACSQGTLENHNEEERFALVNAQSPTEFP